MLSRSAELPNIGDLDSAGIGAKAGGLPITGTTDLTRLVKPHRGPEGAELMSLRIRFAERALDRLPYQSCGGPLAALMGIALRLDLCRGASDLLNGDFSGRFPHGF